MNRNKIFLGKVSQYKNEEYADILPADRVSMMWELTAEIWSLRKSPYVERRLQRNVANLNKQ